MGYIRGSHVQKTNQTFGPFYYFLFAIVVLCLFNNPLQTRFSVHRYIHFGPARMCPCQDNTSQKWGKGVRNNSGKNIFAFKTK